MGNGPSDKERWTGKQRKPARPDVQGERRTRSPGRRARDLEVEAMEALYYSEVRSIGRKMLTVMKNLERVADTGAKTAAGLKSHIEDCTRDAQRVATELVNNVSLTKKISDHQDGLVVAHAQLTADVKTIGDWAKPKINAEINAERFWKMAGDALSSDNVNWVWKTIAVSAGLGVAYLFGGKALVGWVISKIVGG